MRMKNYGGIWTECQILEGCTGTDIPFGMAGIDALTGYMKSINIYI
jgi:hypothetical protein